MLRLPRPSGRVGTRVTDRAPGAPTDAARVFDRAFHPSPLPALLLGRNDGELVVVAANLAATVLLGATSEELLGRPWTRGLRPVDRGRVALEGLRLLAGGPGTSQLVVQLRPGRHRATQERDDGPEHEVALWVLDGQHDAGRLLVAQVLDRTTSPSAGPPATPSATPSDRPDVRGSGSGEAPGILDEVVRATTGTGIIGTDADGTITFFNPGAEAMLGWSADEVVGACTPERFLVASEMRDRAEASGLRSGFGALVAAVRGGAPHDRQDWTFVRKDGGHMTVSLTVSAMRDRTGTITGYLGVAEDVTAERRAERTLRTALAREQEAVRQLQRVHRLETDLVSSVSHELRTPITSVLGYSEMLRDGLGGTLSDEQRRLVDRVSRNGRRLLDLVENLLSLSRAEAGTFAVAAHPVRLDDVVRRGVEALETQLCGRDLELRVLVDALPVIVAGDAGELERVVTNLLVNAVKFTPDGGRVTVRLAREQGSAVLVVEDTGVGIAPSDQERVFERFFRAAVAHEQAVQGTGLGLSLVRTITEAHGGTVEVASEPGEGSRFTVRLPLEAGTPAGPTE